MLNVYGDVPMIVVTMYSKDQCPYCDLARTMIKSNSLYVLVEKKLGIDFDRDELAAKIPVGRKLTVPQIWIGTDYIGGSDDLERYLNNTKVNESETSTGPIFLTERT